MNKMIMGLVLVFTSGAAMAADVWFDCDPINGQSAQVLRDASIVLTASNGVATTYPTQMYNKSGPDYVTVDGQLILSVRGSNTAIYDRNVKRISDCAERSARPQDPPKIPPPYQGGGDCPGCMNDGGFP